MEAQSSFNLVLVDTGLRAQTCDAVARVKELVDKGPGKDIIATIGELTSQIKQDLENKSAEGGKNLLENLRKNQALLKELGLSNAKIDAVVDLLAEFGYTAKITGKGMGGFVLGVKLATDSELADSASLRGALESKGCTILEAQLSSHGLEVQQVTELSSTTGTQP